MVCSSFLNRDLYRPMKSFKRDVTSPDILVASLLKRQRKSGTMWTRLSVVSFGKLESLSTAIKFVSMR